MTEQAHRTDKGARTSRDQRLDIVTTLEAENERTSKALIELTADLDDVGAERDRLASLLVVERAIFESELAQAKAAGENAQRELDALRQTKLFRYTSDVRHVYGLVRRTLERLLGRR